MSGIVDRQAVLALVHRQMDLSDLDTPEGREAHGALKALEEDILALATIMSAAEVLDEALNSGDGVYRP